MKKTLPFVLLTAAVLGVAFTVGGRSDGNNHNDGKCPPAVDRGAKVTGAWLYVVDFGNGPFESQLQLFADGNAVVNNTVINEGKSHLTAALGAWKRTGPRSMVAAGLIRIVNPDGELLFYEKIVAEGTIEGDVLTGQGTGLVYLPSQDPLNPDETPVQVLGPSLMVGRRLSVETLTE